MLNEFYPTGPSTGEVVSSASSSSRVIDQPGQHNEFFSKEGGREEKRREERMEGKRREWKGGDSMGGKGRGAEGNREEEFKGIYFYFPQQKGIKN